MTKKILNKKKASSLSIAALAAIVAIIGINIIFLSRAAGPSTYYVSTSGSDANSCSISAPCLSFSRAYSMAEAGSTVEVASGLYGAQTFANLSTKDTNSLIVFRPASGATVETGYMSVVNSQNIEIRDMKVRGWGVTNSSKHIVYRNLVAKNLTDGGYISGADDFQLIGGEISNIDPGDAIHFNNDKGINTNIVFDGIYVHDLTFNNDPSAHDDCIQTGDVRGLTIKNSRFMNCGTQGVFLNPYNGGVTTDITVENNMFGVAQLGSYILYIGDATNVTLRNNSFSGWAHTNNSSSFTNLKSTNNIFGSWASYNCGVFAQRSAVFANNVVPVTGCGGTNTVVNSNAINEFVNSSNDYSAFNLHLKSGATAIDKGANCTATDIDGGSRPQGAACDIGADEFGSSSPPPTGCTPAQNVGNINCDGKIDVFDLSIMLSNYGKSTGQASNAAADVNSNGSIDFTDLSILLSNYGM